MRRHLLWPLAALALAAAGCGSDDAGSSASTAAPAAAAPAGGDAVAVGMSGLRFDPADVTVKVGQTVTWTDEEDIPHNVTADSGASFKSKTFGKGASFSFKATEPATIKYECTLHPGMEGTLTVVE